MNYTIQRSHGELIGNKVVTSLMDTDVALDRGEYFRLDGDRRGLRIQALEGRVWLTETGDRADIILQPGEAHRITRAGRILVEGLPAARVRFIKA